MSRFLENARIWEALLDASTSRVRAELEAGHRATIEANLLRPITGHEMRAGTKPVYFLEDERGDKFVLKVAEPALMAAEQAAWELRRLGGRPAIPARVTTVTVEGLGELHGLLKPYVDLDQNAELDADTTTWSELQRTVMLLEHAWEYLLDNLDANTSQYALLGPDAYPVNIDWDRSFSSEARSELSRFAKYSTMLPNARTFLYSDYVEGRTDLRFAALVREGRRVRQLPEAEVRRIVERYAAARYTDAEQARAFVERVIDRQRRIEGEIANFVRDLQLERIRLIAVRPRTAMAWTRNILTYLWNQWQVSLSKVVRGPLGDAGRRFLRLVRGRSSPALR